MHLVQAFKASFGVLYNNRIFVDYPFDLPILCFFHSSYLA